MSKLVFALLIWVTGALASAGVLVTDLTGKAQAPDKRALGMLSEIADGGSIELAEGAIMVVADLASGREFLLAGPGQFRVNKSGVQGMAGASVTPRSLPASNLPEVKVAVARVAQATLTMRGGSFSSAAPSPLVPARTAVLSATPTLRWSAVEGATSYRVTLFDEAAKQILDATTRETELPLQPSSGLIGGRQYSWRVEALNARGRIADASTIFSVVAADVIKMLEQLKPDNGASYSRRVLYAAQLQEAGAVDEARQLWQALAREKPDDPNLGRLAR
jgi:hypothetical protein